ncbi:MAG: hypothetical protein Q7S30_02155 [Candidatus Omnitrophota bacterium]|nr:hypothetical protein [Candidatus Omnitrophota bacterium]
MKKSLIVLFSALLLSSFCFAEEAPKVKEVKPDIAAAAPVQEMNKKVAVVRSKASPKIKKSVKKNKKISESVKK